MKTSAWTTPWSRQPLHHPPRDQFVVVRADELPGDSLERLDEAGEVSELVDSFRGGERERRGVVAPAQFNQRGWCDRPLEMEMDFSLGKAADERRDVVHRSSLASSSASTH